MLSPGTVDEWRAWTKQAFPGSGSYVVAGALNPVAIDVENDIGTYTEANVWIVHDTGNARDHTADTDPPTQEQFA